MAELVFNVHDIEEAGKDFSFELSPAWLDAALEGTGLRRDPALASGSLEVHAQKNGEEILVDGQLVADLLVDCARCLGDTKLPVRARVTALLRPAAEGEVSHEVELEADDLELAEYSGHEVVLDELVREQLVLEQPMQALCKPDCAGIALPAGMAAREGAVDPRLAPLADLKARLSGRSSDEGSDKSSGKAPDKTKE